MSPDIYVESRHIGYAILWGLKLAFYYDGLFVFRNVIKHKDFLVVNRSISVIISQIPADRDLPGKYGNQKPVRRVFFR